MKKSSETTQEECFLTIPPLVWLAAFFLIPTCIVFLYALKPFDTYGGIGEGWSLETVIGLFNPSYLKVIWRTIWVSLVTTAISFMLALPTGYYLARAKPATQSVLLLLIILPFWSSFIVRVFAWKLMLHPEGMIHKILTFLHLIHADTILLYNNATVIIVMVYSYMPFAILPIYAAASKFDFHLFEAALDLGMSRSKAFFKIFMPNIRAGIVTALLIVLIPSLGSYVIPDILGGPHSELIGNKIVQRTFTERNLPQASALSAFLTLAVLIPMGIITLLQSRVKKNKTLSAKL